MAGSLTSMGNFARIAKVVALLLFLLPWVVVSCSPDAAMRGAGAPPPSMVPGAAPGGNELAKATGIQIAAGSVRWQLPPESATQPNVQGPAKPWSTPDIPAAAGALLILLSLVASFVVKGRTGALVAALGSLLAGAALYYSVMIHGRAAVADYFGAVGQGRAGGGGPSPPDMAQMIHYEVQIGFWLVLVALAAAIVLDVMAMKGVAAAPAASAAAPPPPEPPTEA